MENLYEHKQKGGWWMYVFVLLIIASFFFAGLVISLPSSGSKYFLIVVSLLITGFPLWGLMSMSSLTISIDQTFIRLCFGPGLWKKNFPLDQIAECRATLNTWPLATGVHWVVTGWLYHIAGRDVVELTFKNGKKAYLGTDEPEKLYQAIEQVLYNK